MPDTKGGAAKWLKIELLSPPELVDGVTNFLTEIGADGAVQEETEPFPTNEFAEPPLHESLVAYLPCDVRLEKRIASLQAFIESLAQLFPDLEKVSFAQEVLSDPDWAEQWKKYFKPLRASKNIVIKPTWERYTPLGHDIVIEIDPGMAFGTGQHPSTRMCLEAVEEILLKDRTVERWRVIDVGTGTGILGISCAKLGAQRVVCVDIDKKAAEIARENAIINQVEDKVEVQNRDVTTIHERFDLIVANLTARILLKLRNHFVSILENGGYLVISGIVDQNREDVQEHFVADAFSIIRTITEKEWLCFVLKKG